MRFHPFKHLGLKVLAISLASLLWLTVAGEHVVERSLRVPLEFRNIPEALEIVAPDVHDDTLRPQLLRASPRLGRGDDVGRVDFVSLFSQQYGRRAAAASEADDSDLAHARYEFPRTHLSLSVLSAMKANRTPMIQKRTVTCASSQPLTSKWW